MKKIHVHPVLWFILGIGMITGMFKEVVMLFVIVFVHEMGHSWMAHWFKWRIKKIHLLPFGGMAETEEYGNRPVKEEVLVTIFGPIQHIWLIGISYILLMTPFWSNADHKIFLLHNLTILLFNLLPILPLDGGKLLFSLSSSLFPFYKSYYVSFTASITLLSLLTMLSLTVLPFHLNLVFISMFLWVHHYLEWRQRHYMFLRFLLERKRVKPKGKVKVIQTPMTDTVAEAVKNVYRNKEHIFSIGQGTIVHEHLVLEAFFDRNKRSLPINEIP
ncbi:M50 family metallopeptidase [Bacillus shivajii]|uniref:M50 family metallopeptidase n=1 Tax=Bacillus shivajii TaxID=1983719 RepID=UPI001CFBC04E|nr:M50 family metallopeptidase [Bacillus shivajii]UCZ52083.1 M50 family metallopeptidase [Bacillus shivajii]